jgi:hypothetical protein
VRWKWRADKKRLVDGKTVVETPRNYGEDCIIADGLHPPIVELAVFEAAQVLMAESPPAPVSAKYEIRSPLAGIVFCGKCGRRMVRRNGYKKPDYLVCSTRGCDNVSAPLHLVEERVLQSLKKWLGDYRVKWELPEAGGSAPVEFTAKALKKAENEIATLNKQLGSTYDLLEQDIYSTEEFLDRSRSLGERIERAKADRDALEKELGVEASQEESRRAIIPKVERLLEVYDALPSAAEKNELLKEVLEKTVYDKAVRNHHYHLSKSATDIQLNHSDLLAV